MEKNAEKRKIRGAIFDYDGTIMDSMTMWSTASSDYVRNVLGREPLPGLDERIKNLSLEEGAGIFREEYGAPGTDQEIVQAVLETVLFRYRHTLQLKPGILEILRDLKAHGIPMCIATASAREMIEAGNRRLGLEPYFEKIFTCIEVGANKRKPDIYNEAAAFMGTRPEETLVFEDVLHASVTAAEAGYCLIGVYDEVSKDEWEAISGLSALALADYSQWPGISALEASLSAEKAEKQEEK